MKKAEIAIGVVIVIALGLLVLISLAVLLVSQVNQAEDGLSQCTDTYGGVCTLRTSCIEGGGRVMGLGSCTMEQTTERISGTNWAGLNFALGGSACCVY